MVIVKEVLEKNNLNLKLKQGLLDLDVGNKDYEFVDASLERGDTLHGLDHVGEVTKVFYFKSNDGHKLAIYPYLPDYTLWLSTCRCYYDENGDFLTELIF